MQTHSLCCVLQQNAVTFLGRCHYNNDLLISISLFRPQLGHNAELTVVSKLLEKVTVFFFLFYEAALCRVAV